MLSQLLFCFIYFISNYSLLSVKRMYPANEIIYTHESRGHEVTPVMACPHNDRPGRFSSFDINVFSRLVTFALENILSGMLGEKRKLS